jgi:glycosyltransferase involved in cell wall biosynthesis
LSDDVLTVHIVHYNLTTTTKEGGVETFVWDLAREQARSGQRVTIVSGAGPVRRDAPGVEVKTAPYVDRGRFAVGPLRRAWAIRKLLERLSMLPRAYGLLGGADLVHIHKPYDLPLAPLLKRRRVPLVYHGHGEGFFPGDRTLARAAAALLSCSTYNASTLRRHYGREATVVYNGVDVERFSPREPDRDLRARLLGRGDLLLLLPGRMMPWKGQQHAVEALARIGRPGLRLVLVGDGETRGQLEAQARAAGVADQVVFAGTVPHVDMPGYYAVADVVLGTSFASETFGMALAEAMACGRPVLASTWQGFDDVVRDGETGVRFEAADPEGLASALRALLDDRARRLRVAEAGRSRVLANFTWPQVAARVQAVYEALRR